jgi:hypothetical protein
LKLRPIFPKSLPHPQAALGGTDTPAHHPTPLEEGVEDDDEEDDEKDDTLTGTANRAGAFLARMPALPPAPLVFVPAALAPAVVAMVKLELSEFYNTPKGHNGPNASRAWFTMARQRGRTSSDSDDDVYEFDETTPKKGAAAEEPLAPLDLDCCPKNCLHKRHPAQVAQRTAFHVTHAALSQKACQAHATSLVVAGASLPAPAVDGAAKRARHGTGTASWMLSCVSQEGLVVDVIHHNLCMVGHTK